MKHIKKLLLGGIIGLSLLSMACTPHPSQEELQTLIETRQSAEAAEQKIKELQQEKKELQSRLDAKQQELQKAEAEQARVKKAIEKRKSEMGEGGE